jgi:hypothetical protein
MIQPPRAEAQVSIPVRVVNTPASPALTHSAPAEVFRTITTVLLTDGAFSGEQFLDPVPAGKRLVIESVEVSGDATVGKPIRLVAFRTGIFAHPIAVQKQSSTATKDYYVGTHKVNWYADPGDALFFFAQAPGENAAGTASFAVTITGRYVPTP